MIARTLLASCLMLLVSVQGAALAPRAAADSTTAQLAPRAVSSGVNNCYFQCPERFTSSVGQTAILRANSGAGGVCRYDGMTRGFTCVYNGDGNLSAGDPDNDSGCPTFAGEAGCAPVGTGPPAPNNFRRSTRRGLTRAQEIIRARQYRPNKAFRRQADL